jgi:hypothetical protein
MGGKGNEMSELSRRVFLIRGSLGAAAIGAAAAMPGIPALATAVEGEAPAADDAATSAVETTPTMTEPLIAHVKDLETGEISLYMGEQEFTYLDPNLAARLVRAAK